MYTFEGNETAELFAAFGRIGNYLMTDVCPKLRWKVDVMHNYLVGDLEFFMTLKLVNPRELSPESLQKGYATSIRCELVRDGTRTNVSGTQTATFKQLCATCEPSESVVWAVERWDAIQREIEMQMRRQNEFVRDLGTILPGRSCEV